MQRDHATAGEARLTPNGDLLTGERSALDQFVRAYFHLIVFAAIAAFLVGRRLRQWYLDARSRAEVRAAQKSTDDSLADGVRLARERQQLASREAQRRDAEVREQRRMEELAEKERKLREIQQAEGARLGAGAEAGAGAARLPFEGGALPRLPSGQSYQPSSAWGGNGAGEGGGYRPTGFRRPARGG